MYMTPVQELGGNLIITHLNMANRNPFALPDIAGQSVAPTQGSSSAPKIPTFDIRKPATDTTAVDTKVSIANIPDPTAGTFADFKPIDIRQTPVVDTLDVTKLEATPKPVIPLAPTSTDVETSTAKDVLVTTDTTKDTTLTDFSEKKVAEDVEVIQTKSDIDDIIDELKKPTTDETTGADLIKQLKEKQDALVSKSSQILAEEKKLGVPKKVQQLQELNSEIAQLKASLDLGIAQQEAKPIAKQFITGRVAEMRRQATAEIGALATVAQALQGNIQLAQSMAKRTVDLTYAPVEQEISNLNNLISLNYDSLTRSDKKKVTELNLKLQARQEGIDKEKAKKTAILNLAIEAGKNGAGVDILKNITSAKTPEEALNNAVGYLAPRPAPLSALDKLKVQNQQLQNAKLTKEINGLPDLAGSTANITQFTNALIGQESGGNYNALNIRTGASGAFQIMPSNWGAWSQQAGLSADAPMTQENQNKVAKFKIQEYFNKYGSWKDVASVWYSGKPFSQVESEGWADKRQGDGSEPSVRQYVNSILSKLPKTKVALDQKETAKLNKELVTSDAYKSLRTAKNTWGLINAYEKVFEEVGNQRFGKGAARLGTAYNAVLLDMKELFNLGVLNGPDLELMEKILINPTQKIGLSLRGGEAGISAGIDQAKSFISTRIDDNFQDIKTSYQDYSPNQLTGLQTADRFYNDYVTSRSDTSGKLLVERISDGSKGTVLQSEFDPKLYKLVKK